MAILKWLGIGIILLWLVLWLALKITVFAIHGLFVLGLVLIVIGFFKASTGPR
jgi:hypothetical protein